MNIKFNFKAFVTAFLIALTLSFSLGIFANAPKDMTESFEGEYWYYINRGYPVAWAGVMLVDTKISLPFVHLPFISLFDGQGTEFGKIIDLSIFVPLILGFLVVFYIPVYFFVKAVDENKKLNLIFVFSNVFIFLLFIYIYLVGFSRL